MCTGMSRQTDIGISLAEIGLHSSQSSIHKTTDIQRYSALGWRSAVRAWRAGVPRQTDISLHTAVSLA